MWRFFKEWRTKQIRLSKINECAHVFHIVSEYQRDTEKFRHKYDMQPHYDMYCPKCDHTEYGILKRKGERELKKQEIRHSHEKIGMCKECVHPSIVDNMSATDS